MNPKHLAENNLLDSTAGKALAVGVITAEVSPLNEAIRVAVAGYAQYKFGDPYITGAVYGAATAIIEGSAALITAEALDTSHSKNLVGKVNEKLQKIGIDKYARTNTATDAGIGLLGGSAVSMLVKQAQDPERTKNQNKTYGLKMTAGLTAVCAVQGYAVAEGIADPGLDTIAVGVLALGGVYAASKMALNRVRGRAK